MAVVYMRKLEEEPDTYDEKFKALTKGINLKVQKWVLEHIKTSESILEVGCGTGNLVTKMALKGNSVIALDKNPMMINNAMKNYPQDAEVDLLYQIGTIKDWSVEEKSQDVIVSTFLLSELRPFEQQIFLRNAWKSLKSNGNLILAAEFVPYGFWKLGFKLKRWWYKKKLKWRRSGLKHPLRCFNNYIEPIGFKLVSEYNWKHGSIRAIVLQKDTEKFGEEPGFYQPIKKKFKGINAKLRIIRCLFTGQIDHVAKEPGIYSSGNPTPESPIIVTANYDYTYIRVMKDLKKIDAWVLCVDTRGINVWCAARGGDFGNKQLIEAIEATGLERRSNRRTLLLPQLSAGGVEAPLLHESPEFPFNIKYGPIWSKQLPKYLKEKPARKPEKMKIAKFTFSHRIRAGITHTTFLLRKIFLKVSVLLLILLLALWFLGLIEFNRLFIIGELLLAVIFTNLMLSILFPITNFTRKFIIKGIFIGIVNSICLGFVMYIVHQSIALVLLNICFIFWLGLFSTMSFSGYTMASSPREIASEYPIFRVLNLIFIILGIILSTIGILFI